MPFYEKGKREYIIEGPYPEGSTLFGSSVAGKFQLIEYVDDEIMGGSFLRRRTKLGQSEDVSDANMEYRREV